MWRQDNNLSLQRDQDKGDDCGLQEKEDRACPILIDGAAVKQVESFKFLGVHNTNKLTWSKHTKTVVKRARQSLFPLRGLKRFGMSPQKVLQLHHCLVRQLLGLRPQGTTEGSANGPVLLLCAFTLALCAPCVVEREKLLLGSIYLN